MLTRRVLGRPALGSRAARGRRLVVRIGAVAAVMLGVVVVVPGPSNAGGGVSCPREIPWCTVTGTGGGGTGGSGGGGNGGGGGGSGCTYGGTPVACFQPGLGYYDSSDQCYYLREQPQPARGNPIWAGHNPADGAFYRVTCFNGPPPWGAGQGDTVEKWIGIPAGGMTPRQVALEALASIRLDGPAIHMAPSTNQNAVGGLVGLPVWMWTSKTPHRWGPIGATATDGGLTVTISAKVTKIVWHMGDGGKPVVCTTPGTPYRVSDGAHPSPDCGYKYTKPSYAVAGGRYPITAVASWAITYQAGGNGAGGVIHRTRKSSASVRINQQQVVVK